MLLLPRIDMNAALPGEALSVDLVMAGSDDPDSTALSGEFVSSHCDEVLSDYERQRITATPMYPLNSDGLRRIVGIFQTEDAEDLLQEATVHFWTLTKKHPGQTASWYLHGCRLHLQNYLRRGRSVDSLKRRTGKMIPLSNVDIDAEEEWNSWMSAEVEEETFSQICAADLVRRLQEHLGPLDRIITELLADGLGVREIARELEISHTAVVKRRQLIAQKARATGLA